MKDPLLIPVGACCAPAGALRELGRRTCAYPFDWLVSPSEALLACLREDFARFLDSPRREDRHAALSAIVDEYGFEFRHDFPNDKSDDTARAHHESTIVDNWADFVPEVRAKYARRIARFRDAMASGRPVLLLRRGATTDALVAEVLAILRRRYPALECDVLVANAVATGSVRVPDEPRWNSPESWDAAITRKCP